MAHKFNTAIAFGLSLLSFIISLTRLCMLQSEVDISQAPKLAVTLADFQPYFLTLWNLIALLLFLLIALGDETSILANKQKLHRTLQKIRQYLFLAIVLPGSLVVMTVFWVLWHINRELIFPKDFDCFFPHWLNHIFHTIIIVPIVIELVSQQGNYAVSKKYIQIILISFLTFYQAMYMSVYFRYGVWLYPIYGYLTWTARILFMLAILFYAIGCQRKAFSILTKPDKPSHYVN